MHNESLVTGVGTGLGLIGLCSIPAVSAVLLQLRRREPKQDAYEDEDGKSTPEAVKAYSARLAKSAILLLSSVGLGASLAVAVLVTLHIGKDGLFLENWLTTGAWVSSTLHHAPVTSSTRCQAWTEFGAEFG